MNTALSKSAPAKPRDAAARHAPPESRREMVIRARTGWRNIDWRELWEHRELLYFLIWRDVKVRYKQTVLGVVWAVLQPLLGTFVFTVIFGMLAKIPSDGLPYAAFVCAGLVPWTFFSNGVTLSGQSLVNQQHLMTKIYFPRLFVPTASVGAGLVDLLISFTVYAILLACYGIAPGIGVIAVPALVLLTIVSALGLGYLLAALTVAYRDFRYVIPFMMQVMLYVSPVIYPVSLFPQRYQWILALNPMAGIIDGFRSAILGKPWNLTTLAVSSSVGIGLFVLGLFYFRKTERRFADIA